MTYPRRGRTATGARTGLDTRVLAVTDVTGHMRQIELTGPGLRAVRPRPGAHLVVRVPAGDGHARRVYSIWSHRPADAVLILRLALHPAGGPGCDWARRASPGDRVTVEPPRSKITLAAGSGYHVFIGDDTGAVPLLAMRAALPGATPVLGVFESAGVHDEVPGADGVPPLPWAHRGAASPVGSRVLLRAVQDLRLPPGSGTAYVAGETDTCRLIQRHLVEQRGWSRRAVLMQPQWAPGRPGFGAGAD